MAQTALRGVEASLSDVLVDLDPAPDLATIVTVSLGVESRVVQAAGVESEITGEPLLEVLQRWGSLDEERAVIALALHHRLSIIDLSTRRIDREAAVLLSAAHCRRLACVAVDRRGDVLHVATSRPVPGLAAELEQLTGHPIALWLAETSVVSGAIEATHAPARVWTFSSIGDPIRLLLDEARRVRAGAVRIDLSPLDGGRLSFKIDGAWRTASELPMTFTRDLGALLDSQVPSTAGVENAFEVLTITTPAGEAVTLSVTANAGRRHVVIETPAQVGRSLVSLGIPSGGAAAVRRHLTLESGLLLVAGPLSSGLDTTVGSLLGKFDPAARVVALVSSTTGAVPEGILLLRAATEQQTLAAIAHAQRSDADVVVVPDIASTSVARAVLDCVAEGRLVLGSLRLAEPHPGRRVFRRFGIGADELPAEGLLVVTQRLLRRICAACLRTHQPTEPELAAWVSLGGDPQAPFAHGLGCDVCDHTGYLERAAVVEVATSTGATGDELARCTHPLEKSAIDLVQRQVTSVTDMVRAFAPVISTTAP
jgi:type II secretory ATPase GspE/PulE/Tfp pilus assembly ATPase PilB-like protein